MKIEQLTTETQRKSKDIESKMRNKSKIIDASTLANTSQQFQETMRGIRRGLEQAKRGKDVSCGFYSNNWRIDEEFRLGEAAIGLIPW